MLVAGCSKEAKVEQLEGRAKGFYEAGELQKARIAYLSLLQQSPGNAAAIRQLGMIWMDQGLPLRAIPYLVKTRETDPKDVEARYKLALAFRMLQELKEAREEAAAVLELAPAHGEALVMLAESVRTREEADEMRRLIDAFPDQNSVDRYLAEAPLRLGERDALGAEEMVLKAVELDPESPRALARLGARRMARNDMDGAEQAFRQAADLSPARSLQRPLYAQFLADSGRVDEALGFLRAMGEQMPDFVPVWSLMSTFAIRAERFDEALESLEKLFAIDPDHLKGRLMQVECLEGKREFAKAVELLKKLEQAHPQQPEVKFRLARACVQNESLEEAVVALRGAIALKPDYEEAIFMLARINLVSGRPEEVVPAMRKLLEENSGSPGASLSLADALRALGRAGEAVEVLKGVVAAAPGNIDYKLRLSHALAEAGQTEAARAAVEQALEIDPGHAVAVSRLVDMDLADKAYDVAQARLDGLMAKAPESAAARVIQARIYGAQGKWAEAEEALRQAVAANPEEAGANEMLIQVLQAAGKQAEAVEIAEAALARAPGNTGVLRLAALLYMGQGQHEKAARMYESLRSALFLPDPGVLNNLALLYTFFLNQEEKGRALAREARELRPGVAVALTPAHKLEAAAIAGTLGWILYHEGDYPRALELLREATGVLTDNAEVQYHLGMAAAAMGQDEAARASLALAAASPRAFPGQTAAREYWRLLGGEDGSPVPAAGIAPLVASNPADVALQLRLAEAYERENNLPEAAAAFAAALARNPALSGAARKLAGYYAGPLNDPAKAEELARKARQIAPGDPQVAALLGTLVYRSGDHSFSYELLREAVRGGVRDAPTLAQLARSAYSLGHVSEARSAMEDALGAGPDPALADEARTFLALTAAAESAAADVAAAEAVLAKDPRSVPALMVRGSARLAAGEMQPAQADFEAALAVFPGFLPARLKLAVVLAENPDTRARAHELATQLRSALPDDPEVAEVFGRLNYDRKDYAYALQLFTESARRRPLDPRARYYQGLCQRETGDKESAMASLQQALDHGLTEPLATEARAALEALKTP